MATQFTKARVTHSGGIVSPGRFVFGDGVAAVWVEQRHNKTAQRILYATDAEFIPREGRTPARVVLSDGTEWQVQQLTGGCGCSSVLKGYAPESLLDPDFSSI